jgi:hypothetical protein
VWHCVVMSSLVVVNKDLIPAIHVARVTDPVRPKPYGPVTRPTLR